MRTSGDSVKSFGVVVIPAVLGDVPTVAVGLIRLKRVFPAKLEDKLILGWIEELLKPPRRELPDNCPANVGWIRFDDVGRIREDCKPKEAVGLILPGREKRLLELFADPTDAADEL